MRWTRAVTLTVWITTWCGLLQTCVLEGVNWCWHSHIGRDAWCELLLTVIHSDCYGGCKRKLYTRQLACFCQLFSEKFNIISALFIHQSPTLLQKIDSREGLFWCKKGLVCECSKMNFYLKRLPFVPHFGLFAAKCTAICCKTQCVLVLNAVRFDAKRKMKWC